MRIESSVTSVSWIPREAIEGMTKLPFELGVAHYDLPPPDRLEQLLALEEAGVVSFLGGGLEIELDLDREVFVARSTSVPGEVTARAFVDATLPAFDLGRAQDPLLSALAARGEVAAQVLGTADGEEVDTGQVGTDRAQRLVRADGSVAERRFATAY